MRLDALVRTLTHAYDAAFDEALADRSATRTEFAMLSRLAAADGPLSWEALEDGLSPRIGPAALTQAWNGLAAGGWAVEEDGLRAATDAGREALEDLHHEIEAIHADAVEGVSEADVATATAVLRRMLGNLAE